MNCLLSKICILRFSLSLGFSDFDAPIEDETPALDSDVSITVLPPNLAADDDDDNVEAAANAAASNFSCLMVTPPGSAIPG